jgi:hypothetical protein
MSLTDDEYSCDSGAQGRAFMLNEEKLRHGGEREMSLEEQSAEFAEEFRRGLRRKCQ